MPFGLPDYHKTNKTLHIGCEEPHAYFIPYADERSATRALRDESPYFKTLIGKWQLLYFSSVDEISDVPSLSFTSADKIDVPMNWQNVLGAGYDTPHYTNTNYPFPVDPPKERKSYIVFPAALWYTEERGNERWRYMGSKTEHGGPYC